MPSPRPAPEAHGLGHRVGAERDTHRPREHLGDGKVEGVARDFITIALDVGYLLEVA